MVAFKLILMTLLLNVIESKTFDANKEFIIQSQDKKFLALIYLKQNIRITLIEIEIISASYYFVELNLELLCKYNKIFKQYDTLEEAYDCIQKLFEKDKIKIYNTNNDISLGFIMNSASCDNEEVIIKLEEKKMDKDEINEKLRIETNILTKKIKVLEEEIKPLKEKVNDYELRLSYLELKSENIDTKIIYKKSELEFIIEEFKEKYKKKYIQFNLRYRASRDGDKYDNIISMLGYDIYNHNYYNKNLLVLFHTDKGSKFGAFLPKGFEIKNNNDQSYNYDKRYKKNNFDYYETNIYSSNKSSEPKAFMFSIDTKRIFYQEKDDKIVCFNKKNSGDSQIKDCLINLAYNYFLGREKYINNIIYDFKKEKSEEKEYFNLKEFEIFFISFS